MIEKITEELLAWCKTNYIKIIQENERLFDIPSFGKCYLVIPLDDKILDQEMMFIMDDEELIMLQNNIGNFNYFIFSFGKQFYYCKPELKKDSFNEHRFVVDFTDLKYVGENTLESDVILNHLGIHTEYDMLNGNGLKNYIKKAKFFHCTSLGMCDKNTLAGTLAWQTECKASGIKPILGMTVDVATNYNAATPDIIPSTYELKLYVTSYAGWQNLLQINRYINVTYPKFIPENELIKYTKDIVCVVGMNSELIWRDRPMVMKWYTKFKGFHNIYLQLSWTQWYDPSVDSNQLRFVNDYLKGNYRQLIPPILLYDVYYGDEEQYIVRDYLNKVAKRAVDYSEDQWFKSFDEVNEQASKLFKNEDQYAELLTESLNNLDELCNVCKFEIETGKSKLPKYEFVEGKSNLEFFKELLENGIKNRVIKFDKDESIYRKQMQMELDIISGAGFIDYFLILWDIIHWAKSNDIMVGPGRGSVGGSVIAFLISITDVDPIHYKLSFERFINAARVSGERAKSADALPDIDFDVESKYRDILKEYISQRFGELNTCSIGTYTNIQLRGGIKDFGGTKGLTFSYLNFVTADISSQAVDYTFKDFVDYALKSKILKEFFQKHYEIINVIKWTLGQPKAQSIHASAVMILPKENEGCEMNVFNWVPIHLMDGKFVSQWEGKWTDKFGALKEDVLGLSTLDDFKNTLELIKRNHNKDIDLNRLNFDDKKTYKIFQQGFNENVFQFNGEGIKNYSRKVKPDTFEDLIAMNALWRPGPMESNAHLDYALFKHGKKKIHFDYGLRSVTENTQGLYIYQEQMMSALVVLGGFTPVESDVARTQIKKFDTIGMKESETKFISGAIKKGCPEKEAKKIWQKLLAFSNYGFNRSHSAAYAMIAYQTQWLKANYPLEFWTTSISSAQEGEIPAMLNEIQKLKQNINIKPPSINHSNLQFQCDSETNSIYWSLTKIKGIGINTVQNILEERNKNGVFQNYEDFINRVPKKSVNKGHLEKMILAGVFDEVENIHSVTDRFQLLKLHCKIKDYPLPEQFTTSIVNKSYFWLMAQKTLTGLGQIDYRSLINNNKSILKVFKDVDTFFKCRDYDFVAIGGQVFDLIKKKTRKGDDFFLLKLNSNNDVVTILFWSDYIEPNVEFLEQCIGRQIYISGKVRFDVYSNSNSIHICEESKMGFL